MSELLKLAEMWQPIDTAPKDGTDLLVHWDENKTAEGCLVVSWNDDPTRVGWQWETLDGPFYHREAFSHWMPLPPSPALRAIDSMKREG